MSGSSSNITDQSYLLSPHPAYGVSTRAPSSPLQRHDENDSVTLHRFVGRLQVIAGYVTSSGHSEGFEILFAAVNELPTDLGPLAWWAIRGLLSATVERLSYRSHESFECITILHYIASAGSVSELRHNMLGHINAVAPLIGRARNDDVRVECALTYIHNNFARPSLTLDDVSAYLRLSRSHVSRLLHREYGLTYREILRWVRMEHAKTLLRDRTLTVKEIAAASGYAYATELDRQFRQYFGFTPTQWRNEWCASRFSKPMDPA